MQRYYWAAKAVTQLNQILLLNIEERVNGPQDAPMRPINDASSSAAACSRWRATTCTERDPHAILETFLSTSRPSGVKGLSARTLRALYNARDADGRRVPPRPGRTARTFMQILHAAARARRTPCG